MGSVVWILAISFCAIAECHLNVLENPKFHLIPRFPEDFLAFDEFLNRDPTPADFVPLENQHDSEIKDDVTENYSDILAKELPKEEHIEEIKEHNLLDQEDPLLLPDTIKIISGKPEDAKLSVIKPEPSQKDTQTITKPGNTIVNTEGIKEKPVVKMDADNKKDDPELTKNTDYLLVPVANINTGQLNPSGIQSQGYQNLQSTNMQPNQYENLPQNYNPNNNVPNGGNNKGQPLYVVNVPYTEPGNNPARPLYYGNNPSNNIEYHGTPYKLVPMGNLENRQSNYVAPNNQQNYLGSTQGSIPINNPTGYYVMPNNGYNQRNDYQPNTSNGYIVQPNNYKNLNYQPNNPNVYVPPNNLNNQQNYPSNNYEQPTNYNNIPSNMNYQQYNPNGYINQPNNLNYPNYPNGYSQQNNPNGYINRPNQNGYVYQPNNYPNNPNIYNNQPNQYGLNQPNNFNEQPRADANQPNDQQNGYANNPNDYNYQSNYPNSYNAHPNNGNYQQNYSNGYNSQPNDENHQENNPNGSKDQSSNVNSYKDEKEAIFNKSSDSSTSGAPLVVNSSDIEEGSLLVPLFALKDGENTKSEDVIEDKKSKE